MKVQYSLVLFGAIVQVHAQPGSVQCPDSGNYAGNANYIGKGPKAAPIRGVVACVDNPKTVFEAGQNQVASRIYGPLEAGFNSNQLQQLFSCTVLKTIPSGLDTSTAEKVGEYICNREPDDFDVLDDCGGHALPYHYHEKMTCLYVSNETTGHSTRIGTALDGNGIYGKYVNGGTVPTDLDACGGRYGVTPDSNGETVYYYVVQDKPPFTIGCFGPVSSVDECKQLYATCGDDETDITTADGTFKYDLDCPCYVEGKNVLGSTESNTPSGSGSGSNGSGSAYCFASLMLVLISTVLPLI